MAAFFDAGLQPSGLTTADAETLRAFEVTRALLHPDFPEGEPTAKKLISSFTALLRDRARLEAGGLQTVICLGVPGAAVPARGLGEVLTAIPELCAKAPVVALGPLGLHRGGPAEEAALLEQLEFAHTLKLAAWVITPRRDTEKLARRTLSLLNDTELRPERLVLITGSPKLLSLTRELGHFAGLSLHPDDLRPEQAVAVVRKLGAERLVLASLAGTGASDLLALPRAAHLLKTAGLSESLVRQVCGENAATLLAPGVASGRLVR